MFSKLFIHFIVWFNIYKNEHTAKLVALIVHGLGFNIKKLLFNVRIMILV
jgi:hypothetical protein